MIPKPHDLGFCFFPLRGFAPALTDLLCSGLHSLDSPTLEHLTAFSQLTSLRKSNSSCFFQSVSIEEV
ncbi:MAG: hypothetical protein EWV84_20405 [Microcystis sp. M_QC_C_20170808_M3Col]|nr:MAG: hypothetical protein EWV84_20405 [Microcystis sp. M_QC_C_20170808_M3Col]